MTRRSRSLIAVAGALVALAALLFYWTQDASPIDLLYRLHGRAPTHGAGSAGHAS